MKLQIALPADTTPVLCITPANDTPPNSIVLNSGDTEMLRCAQDGFYVRGVRVPADEKEALAVYEGFKQWLEWQQLSRI